TPPGGWEKAYDFVGPQSEPGGAVLYLDPGPAGDSGPAPVSSPGRPVERAAPLGVPRDPPGPSAERRVPAQARAGGGWMSAPGPGAAFAGAGAPTLPDLFPGADWLR
ncbi:MAG TPA: hypothetical protein VF142_06375, partial [Longimicrobium sp.]